MSLFDQLVTEALANRPNLSSLRAVVEKELLHHDIFRSLRDNGLLQNLTFIGGTALRLCYRGIRLSEDLDFTGGSDFSRNALSEMGAVLTKDLRKKYDLLVQVSEPTKDTTNVDTWTIKVETRPEKKDQRAQRINIDICKVPSYDKRPMLLLNHYGVDMGTNGLIVQTQSREEIFTDKLIAFAFRPNRIKYRDLWDIAWLEQQTFEPRFDLIMPKLKDRNHSMEEFLTLFDQRQKLMQTDPAIVTEFRQEMLRFLPEAQVNQVLEQDNFWGFLVGLMEDFAKRIRTHEAS